MLLSWFVAPLVLSASLAEQPYPKCMPFDEGSRRQDFVAFRTRLKGIIARRDAAALLRLVHPQIKSSFGGDDDVEAFVRWWHPEDPNSALWKELGRVVDLGGAFHRDDWFEAPYMCEPAGYDPFTYVVLVASNVRVRAAPQLRSKVLETLSYTILPLNRTADTPEGWTAVTLADGRTGFVRSDLSQSPVGYRAHFSFINGEWKLTIFLAGD